jgi:hypothetical protein
MYRSIHFPKSPSETLRPGGGEGAVSGGAWVETATLKTKSKK